MRNATPASPVQPPSHKPAPGKPTAGAGRTGPNTHTHALADTQLRHSGAEAHVRVHAAHTASHLQVWKPVIRRLKRLGLGPERGGAGEEGGQRGAGPERKQSFSQQQQQQQVQKRGEHVRKDRNHSTETETESAPDAFRPKSGRIRKQASGANVNTPSQDTQLCYFIWISCVCVCVCVIKSR